MPPEKTITLTWTKPELQLIIRCLSLYQPRKPLLLSSADQRFHCPTCGTQLPAQPANYCSACGQSLEWDDEVQWADPPQDGNA